MTKSCPACLIGTISNDPGQNSVSRFVDIYICPTCGVREAMQGWFWKDSYTSKSCTVVMHQQREWDMTGRRTNGREK